MVTSRDQPSAVLSDAVGDPKPTERSANRGAMFDALVRREVVWRAGGGRTALNAEPVDPAIGTTHLGQGIFALGGKLRARRTIWSS
jgi:hypothetical protein